MTPSARLTVNDFWFVAWWVGGFLVIALNGVFTEIWYWRYWRTAVFEPPNPPPGWHTRQLLLWSIQYWPLIGVAYAAAGAWLFRRRGVCVMIYAVLLGLVSFAQAFASLGLL